MFPYSHQQDGLHLEPIRLDWSPQRQTLWQHGVALHGPRPRALVDPVPPDELRRVVLNKLLVDWSSVLTGPEPEWLRTREYQAFAIQTMCRALYTLELGVVCSKPVAAHWASATLAPPWPALIAQALVWRHDRRPDDMIDMLNFVGFTVTRCRQHRDRGAHSQCCRGRKSLKSRKPRSPSAPERLKADALDCAGVLRVAATRATQWSVRRFRQRARSSAQLAWTFSSSTVAHGRARASRSSARNPHSSA
jgi:hypothetical protein